MNSKYVTSKEKLLAYIGKKYTMSESMPIDNGKASLIGIVKPAEHTEVEYKALQFQE